LERERLAVFLTVAELDFDDALRTVADEEVFLAVLAGFRDAVRVELVRVLLDAVAVFLAELADVFDLLLAAGFFDLLLLAEDAASAGDKCKVINATTNRLRIRAIILPSGPVTGVN
jgi:hypothetical protein